MTPDWLPDESQDRVAVSCTARRNGLGPRALPARRDGLGSIAAVMVEDPDDARVVLAALDRPGRTIYVDVERKQPADLMAVALEVVREAEVRHAKPNDATVRSADVLVSRYLGPQLANRTIGLIGVGNLGFKTALMLAERNARVLLHDIRPEWLEQAITTINGLLPAFNDAPVAAWGEERVDALLTCSSVPKVVDVDAVERLADDAFVLDVGIDNLTPAFVEAALARGATIVRLDTRADGEPVPMPAPGFFEEAFGTGELAGIEICSGGLVGPRGMVVVDAFAAPTKAFGIANGRGGLLAADELDDDERERLQRVRDSLGA